MPAMPALSCRQYLFCAALMTGVGLTACTSSKPVAVAEAPVRAGVLRDFSGHWEKNYQLSDDLDARIGLFFSDIQRRYASQNRDLQGGPALGGGLVNADAINGLARFAEEITRTTLIEIDQDEQRISIERENDFTLRCAYADRQFARSSNAFGADVCGWNDERLVFNMSLAGGLSIAHQFSLSPDARMLNVTTTVSSAQVAVPLVISNFYTRFEPTGEDYDCVLTLTRNRVCSQRGTAR